MVPVLETPRLRLRAFRPQDFEPQARTLSDEQVIRFVGGKPLSAEESWRRLLTSMGLWSVLGYGYWAVERREDERWIGLVGFADFKRDMSPSIEGLPEMGWIFASDAHGQGYAGEAIAAGLAWADQSLAGQEIVAIIDSENAASIRVAGRAGFTRREEATYNGKPILLFRRPPA